MYNYKQIDIVYNIKKKLLTNGYWEDQYIKCFPGFQFCKEGRYVWQEGNLANDISILRSISDNYTTHRDILIGMLTSTEYNYLINNLNLFHSVYRIGTSLVVTIV